MEDKKLTKENFVEYLHMSYKPAQASYLQNEFNTNKFQRSFGYSEFYDMTIRCANKNVDAVKYFKKNNINYYEDELINNDRTIMLAWENYVRHFYNEAINEYNTYVRNTGVISDKVVEKYVYKLFKRGSELAKKYLIHKNFYKELYQDEQVHVRRFHEIGDYIASLDPENDIEDAVLFYIDELMPRINEKINIQGLTEEQNEEFKYKLYGQYVQNMMHSLIKLKKITRLQEIADKTTINLKNDYSEKQEKAEQKKLTLS